MQLPDFIDGKEEEEILKKSLWLNRRIRQQIVHLKST